MSSPLPPSRRNSNSSNRSAPSSPQRIPRTAPKRRPLHERSDSEKNSIYRQSPFPSLPSQIFSPKPEEYPSEDGPSGAGQYPTIPPKSPKRLISASASLRSFSSALDIAHDENTSSPSPTVPLWYSSGFSNTDTATTLGSDGQPHSKLRRRTLTSTSKSVESASLDATSTALDIGSNQRPQPPHDDSTAADSRSIVSRESITYPNGGQNQSSNEPPPLLRHKSVERLRPYPSNASKSSRARAQSNQAETPRPSGERPRSSSSPNTPTDAFIQALIKSGTNVQYPKLRQPSATSLRSDTSSARAAYPAPLRLQRKRANSQLARTAGIVQTEGHGSRSGSSEANWQYPTLRRVQSQTSFTTELSEDMIPEVPESPYPRTSANWTEELGDTVSELHSQPLKHRRSDYQLNFYGSEPASKESLRSSVGSFYHFLNDSRTAWARIYYRGDDRPYLETPPTVEHLPPAPGYAGVVYPGLEYDSRVERSLHERGSSSSPSGLSSSPGQQYSPGPDYSPGPNYSPGSAGFPDRIYVPRIRPFVRDNNNVVITTATTTTTSAPPTTATTDDDMSISPIPPVPRQPSQHSRASHNHQSLASPVFNPTPAVPHLSPSKREGPGLPYWRVPSFDETSGPLDRSNIQLILFCLGFLLPPAWWIAAFFPLPARPEWWDSSSLENDVKGFSNSFYESAEVERFRAAQWWRNLNRFMAIAGILIVAAVVACIVVATT